ncbi:MAG: tetratricopeptide repeat protein [Bacteroidetes bacterium]|jgi:tetratricopeptide (TPR) repeat protein|nr:tetratricopeptide repeat protein [Bacteroidota bacterium]
MEEDDDDMEQQDENSELIQKSVEKYEEMRERQEKYFFDVDALVKIIDHFIDRFEYEKSLEVTKYAHTLHPHSVNFTLKEAQLYALMGQEQKALQLLEKIEHVNPFDVEVHLIRGNIYNTLEKYNRAIASYRKALEMADDQKDDIYLSLAITYQNMAEYSKAVDYYKLCLLANPSNEVAMEEMIVSLEFSHRLSEGIEFYKRLIDEHPYGYMLWYYLADLYGKQSQFEQALVAYDYCLLIKEDFAPAHLDMAQALAMLERFQEAIDRYKLAFEYCKPDAFTYYNIGECHENLQDMETARVHYKKAVKLSPEMSQAWYGIGVTYEEEDRWYEAIHYIKKAIELDDQNGEYWLALGDCEYRLNNFEEAEECYKKVIDYDPENEEGWIAYSELLSELNRPFEASELINTAMFYHPDNAEIKYRQVCYLYLSGYKQEAYERLAETLDTFPEGHAIIYDLIPSLEADDRIKSIILNKGGRS